MSGREADTSREDRFDEIVADYLDAIESGSLPDENAIVERHPDLAESLRRFFVDHRRMGGFLDATPDNDPADDVTEVQAHHGSTSSPADQPTLGYDEVASEVLSARRVDDYLILSKIAQGGMGVVYKARQISLNRVVALKMIRSGELADVEEVQRFRIEAEAAAQLQHPGIVPIYQIGSTNGQHFFSMAFVEGQSLAEILRDGRLEPRRAANYVMKVARAAHYAHEQDIIHRDIKPANVLIDGNDEPLVTDFGLAKQIKADHELTMTGQILGTASYMPPEQASGKLDQVTAKSDVYSLGALLYALLTQQPPFTGENPMDVLLDVLSKDPASPSSLNIRLSRDLETICMKCLEKEPAKRYATAEALAQDLERYLAGKPILARPISRVQRIERWCKRKPFYAATILLTCSLVVGIPTASIFNSAFIGDMRYVIDTLRIAETPTARKPSLVETAREHYRIESHAHDTDSENEIYSLAARAMLFFNKGDAGQPAKQLFEKGVEQIELLLMEDRHRNDLQSALADCHWQLARYTLPVDRKNNLTQEDLLQSRQHLERAITILASLRSKFPSGIILRERAAAAEADLSAFAKNTSESKASLVAAREISRTWDRSVGLVRFDFFDPPREQIDSTQIAKLQDKASSLEPSDQLTLAHVLLQNERQEEAIEAYQFAFSLLLRKRQSIHDDGLRRCFRDLALLEEGRAGEFASTAPWPSHARGFYEAVLGIRLAETSDHAP